MKNENTLWCELQEEDSKEEFATTSKVLGYTKDEFGAEMGGDFMREGTSSEIFQPRGENKISWHQKGSNSLKCTTRDKKDLLLNGVLFFKYFDPHQY